MNDQKLYLSPSLDLFNSEVVSYNLSRHPNFKQIIDMHQMNAKKRCGLLGRLKSQPVSNLYMGLVVCLFGSVAVAANLAVQHIPLGSLWAAGTQAQELAAISALALVLCLAGGALILTALVQKKKGG